MARGATVGATRAEEGNGRGDSDVHSPGVPSARPTVPLCRKVLSAAPAHPSRSTIALTSRRHGGLAAMLSITARPASERDTHHWTLSLVFSLPSFGPDVRDPPPGSPPGLLHRVIHQGAIHPRTNENGDERAGATVCAETVGAFTSTQGAVGVNVDGAKRVSGGVRVVTMWRALGPPECVAISPHTLFPALTLSRHPRSASSASCPPSIRRAAIEQTRPSESIGSSDVSSAKLVETENRETPALAFHALAIAVRKIDHVQRATTCVSVGIAGTRNVDTQVVLHGTYVANSPIHIAVGVSSTKTARERERETSRNTDGYQLRCQLTNRVHPGHCR